MVKLVAFAGGMVVGYVLGAKAGPQRYDEIVKTVRGLGERVGVLPPADGSASAAHPETLGDLAASATAAAATPHAGP
jgi:hypothetical protein